MVERMTGKVAIVTGAAQGIGRAIARRLAAEGAAVVFADLNLPAAEATAAAVHADTDAPSLAVQVDVTDRAGVEAMLAATLERFGRVDILVNNAGIFGNARFEAMTDDQWQRMLNVNLTSVFLVSQVVVRHWLAHKTPGAIVNIASISGIVSFTDSSHYAAAKMGVIGLTRSLAMEMGPHGIRVNAVAPGIIATEMTRRSLEAPELSGGWLRRIPQHRYGTPEDVAAGVAFLASDDAAYVNGELLFIDGGGTFAWDKPSDAER